jgi:hypothetical protein
LTGDGASEFVEFIFAVGEPENFAVFSTQLVVFVLLDLAPARHPANDCSRRVLQCVDRTSAGVQTSMANFQWWIDVKHVARFDAWPACPVVLVLQAAIAG